ncbi:MAG: FixH family protein [Betaproteobacteria bacterium]|nr:FixH family protein [Betaproteobacteria bacterium]
MRQSVAARAWYREPWPWLLAAGPFTVVVAGAITVWLAIRSDDGLVADDYYKQGLAINQVIHREQAAALLGLRANVLWNFDNQRVRVYLRSEASDPLPDVLALRVLHPTRAGADQSVTLRRTGAGIYDGALSPLRDGRWLLSLEDAPQTWRLMGEMFVPRDAEAILMPQSL